jgi:hypothetical protein
VYQYYGGVEVNIDGGLGIWAVDTSKQMTSDIAFAICSLCVILGQGLHQYNGFCGTGAPDMVLSAT